VAKKSTAVELRPSHAAQPAHPARPARRRNAAATKAAILASARKAFARAGYDGAGVREIAEGAGVTAMLVNRYFGSKEQLFADVIDDFMAHPIILTPKTLRSPRVGHEMAAALVDLTKAGSVPLDGFRVMLLSASSARAAEIARTQMEAHYHRTLTATMRGAHAAQRAALLLAFVAGVQVMGQMIGLSALRDCPPRTLVKLLGPILQSLMDGTPVRGGTARGDTASASRPSPS
jgi:AcrR family transcriptional regulator